MMVKRFCYNPFWKLLFGGQGFIEKKEIERKDDAAKTFTTRSLGEQQQQLFNSVGLHQEKQQPRHHVYYLKTHKTGSTTLFTILAEYCRTNGLMPLLPRHMHINENLPFHEDQILFARNNISKYDMLFNHHIFTPRMLSYLHNDTFKLTTVREPFDTFVSAFNYYAGVYKKKYLTRIPGKDPIMEFLLHRRRYEVRGYRSYTNNRQSMDLGYNLANSFNNVDYIQKFIKDTEKRFDLVIITEYFDEGLVILKRALHWTTEDIIYTRKNTRPKTDSSRDENAADREALKRKLYAYFSKADTMLYQHFLHIFKKKMTSEPGLAEEVREFRNILSSIHTYCKTLTNTTESLKIERSKWSDGFQVTPSKCKWLYMKEISMTFYLKTRQHAVMDDDWWREFVSHQLNEHTGTVAK